MYAQPTGHPPLDWDWVDRQLSAAGTYWVLARSLDTPHPRPVWGVWHGGALHLSIGSPTITRLLQHDPGLTVHLDSGTDVVIVAATAVNGAPTDPGALEAYRSKYGQNYDTAEFGELTRAEAASVIAWRAAGWAGRDGFRQSGKWMFDAHPDGRSRH